MVKVSKKGTESLTIGKVAKQAGVTVEAIRFYEKKKVLEPATRRESGYREYSSNVVSQIRFIKRAQELGFSLREISELLALRVNPKNNCSPVKKRTETKILQIESKIADLKRIQTVLKKVVSAC